MNEQKYSYIQSELIHVCPFPAHSREFFTIQIRSDDGRKTKWLNITPDQFKAIELVLSNIEAA